MATWRAEVFVNSRVGRINTEVEAATFTGAKEQIYAKHGNVQQIANLREVSSRGSNSSSFDGDIGGSLGLIALLVVIFLVVEYWKWILGFGIFLLIMWAIATFVKD